MTDLALARELQTALANFTGTSQYHRIHSNTLLTDGAYYLAETAACFWLMDLYASHLVEIDPDKEYFTCLTLNKKHRGADIVIDDGNDNLLAQQSVEYTDFPLDSIRLYGIWSGECWVIMLTSEY
jgi:hypothetical protein